MSDNPKTTSRRIVSAIGHLITAAFRTLGPAGLCAAVLFVFAGGLFTTRGLVRQFRKWSTPVRSSGGTSSITGFENKFQYQPLVVYDSDIKIFPWDEDGGTLFKKGTNAIVVPPRKKASIEFQYEGFAKYVVDIDISGDTVTTNSEGKITKVVLPSPHVDLDSITWTDSGKTNRWLFSEGTDDRWKEFYNDHLAQLISISILDTAEKDENLDLARKQTTELLNTMLGPWLSDPAKGINIVWTNAPPRQ